MSDHDGIDSRIGSTPYAAYCRPKLADLLASVGLDVVYEKARGAFLYREGSSGTPIPVLDLVGGFGAGLLGHNNPELKATLTARLDADTPFLAQCSRREEAGLLAESLNRALATDTRYLCHLANSGAEAVEAAIKHAYKVRLDGVRREFEAISRAIERFFRETERHHPDIDIPGSEKDLGRFRDDLDEHNLAQFELFQRNPVLLGLKGSFHGKTTSALKVTFNQTYREAFEGLSAIRTEFIDPGDVERLSEILAGHAIEFLVPHVEGGRILVSRERRSRVVALCLEIIQGEGGIRPLADEVLDALAEAHERSDLPYILDEIQTGCGRTGSFLAYEATPLRRIDPDYITLSKALGGGLVKIGAVLIREDIYDQDFGILHTSTFSEDELGCAVARRVVDILTRDDGRVLRDVAAKGAYLQSGLQALQARYPGVVRDVRGRGLMLGLELGDLDDGSPLFRFGTRQGFLSLLVASYLLHHHAIRMLAPLSTLLKGNPGKKRQSILRIQPAVDITVESIDRVLAALDEVCNVIACNNEGVLVGHLVGVPPTEAERRDPPRVPVSWPPCPRSARFDARVGFVVHPTGIGQVLAYYFPTLEGRVDPGRLASWWTRLARFLEPDVIHTEVLWSNGFGVEANLVSVPYLPEVLASVQRRAAAGAQPRREDLLRLGEVRDKVQDDDHIPTTTVGLGAFTSIVTDRGLTVNDYEVPITSGNAYTAGLMIQGILRGAELRALDLRGARAAVVGGAGNIGSVLSAVLGRYVGRLKLVGRESDDGLQRLREARMRCLVYLARQAREQASSGVPLDALRLGGVGDRILEEIVLPGMRGADATSGWRRAEGWLRGAEGDAPELNALLEDAIDRDGGCEGNDYISLHLSIDAVRDCDVVTIATSSPQGDLITPALVRKGALVACASVPSNLSAAFKDHLREYLVFDGGYARLPDGQDIEFVGLPRGGLAYGCLSETLILGFDGRNSSFTTGPIAPEQVDDVLELAGAYGFEMGGFKLDDEAYTPDMLADVGADDGDVLP
jgi:acetylornithine/succinyldiaminopimelate/putrescine aminotransferase/predicted amino acid dehydrogenase